jgi:hypothetical protein
MYGRRQIASGRAQIVGAAEEGLLGEYVGADTDGIHPAAGPAAYTRGRSIRVVDEKPTHERQFPIGFLSPVATPVPANSTQTITATPQVIFRSERLAVPNSLVINFQLVDIKVGKDSQLAAPGNLPTECFSNISIGVRMQLDTAEPGITLTLIAQNVDANNPHAFASVLYGTVVE